MSVSSLTIDTFIGNGISPHLRNKYQSNQKAKEQGIPVLKQRMCNTVEDAISFAMFLWNGLNEQDRKCVVKPYR